MADLTLYRKSAVELPFTIENIPAGQTASKFRFMIKSRFADSDADALVSKETTSIDNSTPGTALVSIIIDEVDLDAVIGNSAYIWSGKVTLAPNGRAYTSSSLRGKCRVEEAGVEAVG